MIDTPFTTKPYFFAWRWIYNLENEEGFVPNFSIRDSDKNVLDEYFLNQKEDEDL